MCNGIEGKKLKYFQAGDFDINPDWFVVLEMFQLNNGTGKAYYIVQIKKATEIKHFVSTNYLECTKYFDFCKRHYDPLIKRNWKRKMQDLRKISYYLKPKGGGKNVTYRIIKIK